MTARLFSDLLSALEFAKGEKTEIVLKLGEAAGCHPSVLDFFCFFASVIQNLLPGSWPGCIHRRGV